MNWEAAGAIGEIVGAIGVIATLGYLAGQIKQNSRLLKLSNTQQTLDASRDSFLSVIHHYDIPSLLTKETELSQEEDMALHFWTNAQMRNFENAFIQYKEDALDEEVIEAIREKIRYAMTLPGTQKRWRATQSQAVASYRDWVNTIISEDKADGA